MRYRKRCIIAGVDTEEICYGAIVIEGIEILLIKGMVFNIAQLHGFNIQDVFHLKFNKSLYTGLKWIKSALAVLSTWVDLLDGHICHRVPGFHICRIIAKLQVSKIENTSQSRSSSAKRRKQLRIYTYPLTYVSIGTFGGPHLLPSYNAADCSRLNDPQPPISQETWIFREVTSMA